MWGKNIRAINTWAIPVIRYSWHSRLDPGGIRSVRQEENDNESCPTSTHDVDRLFTQKYRRARDVTSAPNYSREKDIAKICVKDSEEDALKLVYQENMLNTRDGDIVTTIYKKR